MPWNFPFWQVLRFACAALAAGNAALLKHSPDVTGCALAIEELFADAGAPDRPVPLARRRRRGRPGRLEARGRGPAGRRGDADRQRARRLLDRLDRRSGDQEVRARARRLRPVRGARRRRRGCGRRHRGAGRGSTTPARAACAPSGSSCTRTWRTSSWSGSSRAWRCCRSATRPTRPPPSARWPAPTCATGSLAQVERTRRPGCPAGHRRPRHRRTRLLLRADRARRRRARA